MIINTSVIQSLNPCKDRFDNWLMQYKDFNGHILDFLSLEHISAKDKIWVSVRVLDSEILEVFAIDSAFSAFAHSEEAYAAYAADAAADAAAAVAAYAAAAAYAADAADAAYAAVAAVAAYAYAAADADAAYAARDLEFENRVDCLIYLLESAN